MAEGYDGSELIDELRNYLKDEASVLELGMGPGKDLDILNKYYMKNKTKEEMRKVLFNLSLGIKKLPKNFIPGISQEKMGKMPQVLDMIDVVDKFLKKHKVDRIYSCGGGPFYYPQLETLHTKDHLPVFLFVENYMACGSGHCHGCAIKMRNSNDYYLVCQDGPLFSLDEVENPCLIYQ